MSTTFQEKLKAAYRKHHKITALIEGFEKEIPEQTLDDCYVKLKTVIRQNACIHDTIRGVKQEVELEDIFNSLLEEGSARVSSVLILGGAGVGKSTLMQYIAYKWSKGELWQDKFDYVYRVPLKTLLDKDWDRNPQYNLEEDRLKCLAHYHLIANPNLTSKEKKELLIKDIVWQQDKTLLLFDGYDEVAHLNKAKYPELEEIWEHPNIILTSRPNAVDKQIADKFDRKIENTGLDQDGINQYLERYFKNHEDQSKGLKLLDFLEKNASIKGICHIPVNLAMMCFIWSDGDSNEALYKVSNMSDLYQQVVDHLGLRYYSKKSDVELSPSERRSLWKGGEISLKELQVLEHAAFKAMTGGGLEVADNKRLETLIIKGFIAKNDKDSISIQSSINCLQDSCEKRMTIDKVFQYGLLKPQGNISKEDEANEQKDTVSKADDIVEQKDADNEHSETDLQAQSYTFIHLSFQEFLTASYFVKNLLKNNNEEEQRDIANFIARHRNEPRYLMILKFMAGLLSANSSIQAQKAIQIFWDAIMCNPDGILELGVEAKVTLLMHLLNQTKKKEKLDQRTPSLEQAVKLIDAAVFRDTTGFTAQLRESDYLSENIKNGLMECLAQKNPFLLDEKSFDWQQELNPNLDTIVPGDPRKQGITIAFYAIFDLIDSIFDKLLQTEQAKIFTNAVQIGKEVIETRQALGSLLIEKIFQLICSKLKKLELILSAHEEEEVVDFLIIKGIYGENGFEFYLLTIREIIKNSQTLRLAKTIQKSLDKYLKHILNSEESRFLLNEIHRLRKNGLRDIQYITDVIESLLEPLFRNFDQHPEDKSLVEIFQLDSNNEIQSIRENIEISKLFFYNQNQNTRKGAIKVATKLTEIGGSRDLQVVQDCIQIFTSLQSDPDEPVRNLVSESISKLKNILNTSDPQSTQEIPLSPKKLLTSEEFRTLLEKIKASEDIKFLEAVATQNIQKSDFKITQQTAKIIQTAIFRLFEFTDLKLISEYLFDPSKGVRGSFQSCLMTSLNDYLSSFKFFGELLSEPQITLEIISNKLLENNQISEQIRKTLKVGLNELQQYINQNNSKQIQAFLASKLSQIGATKADKLITEIMSMIYSLGTILDRNPENQKLMEPFQEALLVQLKYQPEIFLNTMIEYPPSIVNFSSEIKNVCKKIFHQLLQDEEITPLKEELIIKFINQGLTATLTKNGEVIFQGKRYKLKGDNVELSLERIAKTIIAQQQDILAAQYKENKPIFKRSYEKGGMKEAAVDIEEVRSIVDSRKILQSDFWLITTLKPKIFGSEIVILEQRSAFGDHVIYHFRQQKLYRLDPINYPENPVRQERKEMFGSYIVGEKYQGELCIVNDEVGQRLVKEKSNILEEKEKKVVFQGFYFQQELLNGGGNEDRNEDFMKQMSRKMDNYPKLFEDALNTYPGLNNSQRLAIKEYYKGFVSTFSSVYISSQAIASGQLSIDNDEDFLSPVGIFIKLTSLIPFEIGAKLSEGLEAVRSHIKGTKIKNEANYVKRIAVDTLELHVLVNTVVIQILLTEKERQRVLNAKNEEKSNITVNQIKDFVIQEMRRLKKKAEDYNIFEKEIETSPAFQLGESDANLIISEWIKQKKPQSNWDSNDKEKFLIEIIVGEDETAEKTPLYQKQTYLEDDEIQTKVCCCRVFPEPTVNSPATATTNNRSLVELEMKSDNKNSCCEIF